MGTDSVGRAVASTLDPVLVPAGFAPGQHGERVGGDQIIFCAGHDQLSDAYPRLPQANAQQRELGSCIDLVVEVADDRTVDWIDFEELTLAETLREVGNHQDAELVAALPGRAVTEALPVLSATLTRLFAATR